MRCFTSFRHCLYLSHRFNSLLGLTGSLIELRKELYSFVRRLMAARTSASYHLGYLRGFLPPRLHLPIVRVQTRSTVFRQFCRRSEAEDLSGSGVLACAFNFSSEISWSICIS